MLLTLCSAVVGLHLQPFIIDQLCIYVVTNQHTTDCTCYLVGCTSNGQTVAKFELMHSQSGSVSITIMVSTIFLAHTSNKSGIIQFCKLVVRQIETRRWCDLCLPSQ